MDYLTDKDIESLCEIEANTWFRVAEIQDRIKLVREAIKLNAQKANDVTSLGLDLFVSKKHLQAIVESVYTGKIYMIVSKKQENEDDLQLSVNIPAIESGELDASWIPIEKGLVPIGKPVYAVVDGVHPDTEERFTPAIVVFDADLNVYDPNTLELLSYRGLWKLTHWKSV